MQCVILAGGRGTRLGALAAERPKHLVPVAGRPFADLQLAWLRDAGVDEVVYCIGHLGDQIRAHVGDGDAHGLRTRWVDDGEPLLGTGGALRRAYDEGVLDERFLVLYGDSYLRLDLGSLWRAAASSPRSATMSVYRNDDAHDVSNVIFEGGQVLLYDKTPTPADRARMHHIDYGVSVLRRDTVADVPAGQVVDLATVLTGLSKAGELAGVEVFDRFHEVGTPDGIADLEQHLAERAGAAHGGDAAHDTNAEETV